MTIFPPPERLAVLLPLAVAAGLDLPLTLLLLGSALSLGFETAPPGDLGDLAVAPVLIMAAGFWVLEVWAERKWLSALGWNLAQGIVRPLAAALLALLLLPDSGLTWRVTAALVAAAIALWTQAARSGWRLLLDLADMRRPSRIVVSAAEDATTLALVALLLDAPMAAGSLAALTILLGVAWARPSVRAFAFGFRLLWGGTWGVLAPRRWRDPDHFPRWVARAVSEDAFVPGGGLRGTPAGVLAHPDLDVFRGGWVVVRGGSPLFLYRRGGSTRSVDLGVGRTSAVLRRAIHNRVEVTDPEGRTFALYFPWDGPRLEGLEAEFMV